MESKFAVTLAALRKECACFDGYNKVVRALQGREFSDDDAGRESYIRFAHKEQISLLSILESNGLDDALWALRCVSGADRDLRLYAVWCARQVQHLMNDPRSISALDAAEMLANGDATDDELDAARDAAWAAAGAAAGAAAWAAAGAAAWAAAWAAAGAAAWAAAGAAAGAAAWDAAWDAQRDMFVKMCNGEAPWQVASAVADLVED